MLQQVNLQEFITTKEKGGKNVPSHYRDLVTTTLTQRPKSVSNSKTASRLCLLLRQHHLGRVPANKYSTEPKTTSRVWTVYKKLAWSPEVNVIEENGVRVWGWAGVGRDCSRLRETTKATSIQCNFFFLIRFCGGKRKKPKTLLGEVKKANKAKC